MKKTPHRPGSLPGDWPEDFPHENGNYMCRCCHCDAMFYGHKRRVSCKVCSGTGWSVETPSLEDRLKVQSGPFKGKPQLWFTRAEVLALLETT